MFVNADFTRRVIVTPADHEWVASPIPGVERVMLDRIGAEKARATSLVRYAPGSAFAPHEHPGGEEVLVLSGTFSEDGAHHPAGSYLRNPPGSSHRPSSEEGAVIFVKLRQMAATEARSVRIDTNDPSSWQRDGDRAVCPLFSDAAENVSMRRLVPGETLAPAMDGGAELLVLEGGIDVDGYRCAAGTWVRLPAGDRAAIAAMADGATLYLKTGHLAGMRAVGQ